MHYILLIDTSATCSVSLALNGKVLHTETHIHSQNQAAAINCMVYAACSMQNISLQQLSAIAVCSGPGSYTGLRIGLATAKGICYAGNIPLMLHNKPGLLAFQQIRLQAAFDNYIIILNARDKEYFIAAYDKNMHELLSPVHVMEADAIGHLNNLYGNSLLCCDSKSYPIFNTHYPATETNDINIACWAQFSQEKYLAAAFASLSASEPFYMKEVFIKK